MTRYPTIDLDGALVAVTGAARGIGLATARAFHARGAHVALGDLDLPLAEAGADGLRTHASAHALDVTDPTSFADFLDEASRVANRPLEVLINNAGIMPNASFLQQAPEVDRRTMDVNVFGVINGMRLALPGMIERGQGHVVNVASLAGKFPLKGLAVYNASKFAVVGLTAATRLEMQDAGVSVTAVLPSAVRTELSSGIDLGLLPTVDPEDIADAVVRSVRSRAAEIAVPGYVGALSDLAPLLPESAMRRIRKAFHDDAAVNRVDTEIRNRYLNRILGQ